MTPMSCLGITSLTDPLLQVIDHFTQDLSGFEQRHSEDLWELCSIILGQKWERKTS